MIRDISIAYHRLSGILIGYPLTLPRMIGRLDMYTKRGDGDTVKRVKMSHDEIIELANEYDKIRHIVCAVITDHPDVMRGLHRVQSQNNYSWRGELGECETRDWSPESKAYMVQQFRQLVAT